MSRPDSQFEPGDIVTRLASSPEVGSVLAVEWDDRPGGFGFLCRVKWPSRESWVLHYEVLLRRASAVDMLGGLA